MKVLNWLKKRNIPYSINTTIITINGLRISHEKIKSEKFNSRKDGILCEKYTVKKRYISYFNKAWRDIYQLINY